MVLQRNVFGRRRMGRSPGANSQVLIKLGKIPLASSYGGRRNSTELKGRSVVTRELGKGQKLVRESEINSREEA